MRRIVISAVIGLSLLAALYGYLGSRNNRIRVNEETTFSSNFDDATQKDSPHKHVETLSFQLPHASVLQSFHDSSSISPPIEDSIKLIKEFDLNVPTLHIQPHILEKPEDTCTHVQLVWLTQPLLNDYVRHFLRSLAAHDLSYCGVLVLSYESLLRSPIHENDYQFQRDTSKYASEINLSITRFSIMTPLRLSEFPFLLAKELRKQLQTTKLKGMTKPVSKKAILNESLDRELAEIHSLQRALVYLWAKSGRNVENIFETDDIHPLLSVSRKLQTDGPSSSSRKKRVVYELKPDERMPGYISDWLLNAYIPKNNRVSSGDENSRLSPFHRRKAASASSIVYDPLFELSATLPGFGIESKGKAEISRLKGTPSFGRGTRWLENRPSTPAQPPSSFHMTWLPNSMKLPPIYHSGEIIGNRISQNSNQDIPDDNDQDMNSEGLEKHLSHFRDTEGQVLQPLGLAHLSFLPLHIVEKGTDLDITSNLQSIFERPHSRELPRGLFGLGVGHSGGSLTNRKGFPALFPLFPSSSVMQNCDMDYSGDTIRGFFMQRWLWDQGYSVAVGGEGRISSFLDFDEDAPLSMHRRLEVQHTSPECNLTAIFTKFLMEEIRDSEQSKNSLEHYKRLISRAFDLGFLSKSSFVNALRWVLDLSSLPLLPQEKNVLASSIQTQWSLQPALVAHCILTRSLKLLAGKNEGISPSLWVTLDAAKSLLKETDIWYQEIPYDISKDNASETLTNQCLLPWHKAGKRESWIAKKLASVVDSPIPYRDKKMLSQGSAAVLVTGQTRSLSLNSANAPKKWGCMKVNPNLPLPDSSLFSPLSKNIAERLILPLKKHLDHLKVIQHMFVPRKVRVISSPKASALSSSVGDAKVDSVISRLASQPTWNKRSCKAQSTFKSAVMAHVASSSDGIESKCIAEPEPRTAIAHETYDFSAYHPKMFASSIFYQLQSLARGFAAIRRAEILGISNNQPAFSFIIRTRPDVGFFKDVEVRKEVFENGRVVVYPNKESCCCGNEDWFGVIPRRAGDPYFLRGLYLDVLPVWLWSSKMSSGNSHKHSLERNKLLNPTAGTQTRPWFRSKHLSREWKDQPQVVTILRSEEAAVDNSTSSSVWAIAGSYVSQNKDALDQIELGQIWTAESHLEGFLKRFGEITLKQMAEIEACVVKNDIGCAK